MRFRRFCQNDLPSRFFFSGGHFFEKSKILKDRLPPEDGSDWRETLGKRVSDDFAKIIFRGQTIFRGVDFPKKSKILKARLPPRGWLRLA